VSNKYQTGWSLSQFDIFHTVHWPSRRTLDQTNISLLMAQQTGVLLTLTLASRLHSIEVDLRR